MFTGEADCMYLIFAVGLAIIDVDDMRVTENGLCGLEADAMDA